MSICCLLSGLLLHVSVEKRDHLLWVFAKVIVTIKALGGSLYPEKFLLIYRARVNAEVPHIDAFISNAAIAQVANQQLTKDGFESQLGTNHYGHFLLTHLIFDRIIESKGRIVVVGSNGHKMGLKRIQFDATGISWHLPA